MADTTPTLSEEIKASMEWWRAAGVDHDFTDDATAWMGDVPQDDVSDSEARTPQNRDPVPQADSPAAKTSSAPRVDLLGDSPPGTLAEFREFWLTAPGLDAIGPRGRVPPRGESGAKLMVLVVEPEEGDGEALLSGSQGRLLAKMLNAMGLSESDIYLASALPRPTPMADTASIAAAGMDALTAHHITLAAPQSVLAFGGNILPLIGHDLPKDPQSLREINLVNPPMPLLVSEGLDSLMAMPRLKARFWRRWIEWSAERF